MSETLSTNRIKEYRIKKGMTQRELAQTVGIDRQLIYTWENGRQKLSQIAIAQKISEALGVPINDIFLADDLSHCDNIITS